MRPLDRAESVRWDQVHNPMAYTARLKQLLTVVVVAVDRLQEAWAEGDEAVRRDLWWKLHAAAEAAYDEVYPL